MIGALEVGGAEMHLAQILPRLARLGIEVAVHTLSGRGRLADDLERAGVTVFMPTHAEAPRRGGFAARLVRVGRALVSLAQCYRRWKPDVVHFFLPEAYLAGAPLALFFPRVKRAMSRRSLNDYQAKRPLLAHLERWLHPRMHALLGNAQAVVDQLRQEGAPPERLHLIRNGIDLERFALPEQDARAGLGIAPGTLVILIVANLIPYKGHADLLSALAEAKLPDWCLLCAGRDDGIGAALRGQADRLGIGERVRLLGSRRDVPDLLAAADILVLASHEEGFPNAVIEAMAAGRPVIATHVGGAPEAVLDGETGLIVPPRDPAAMAAALTRIARDPALRARMGAAGRARAAAEYGAEACAARYAALFRDLTAG